MRVQEKKKKSETVFPRVALEETGRTGRQKAPQGIQWKVKVAAYQKMLAFK